MSLTPVEIAWLAVGFAGQATFTARFLVQWIASERRRDSVIPVAFWYLSLAGGLVMLAYATYKRDPVFMTGQSMGVVIYVRNLMLVAKGRRRAAKRAPAPESTSAPATPRPHLDGAARRAGQPRG